MNYRPSPSTRQDSVSRASCVIKQEPRSMKANGCGVSDRPIRRSQQPCPVCPMGLRVTADRYLLSKAFRAPVDHDLPEAPLRSGPSWLVRSSSPPRCTCFTSPDEGVMGVSSYGASRGIRASTAKRNRFPEDIGQTISRRCSSSETWIIDERSRPHAERSRAAAHSARCGRRRVATKTGGVDGTRTRGRRTRQIQFPVTASSASDPDPAGRAQGVSRPRSGERSARSLDIPECARMLCRRSKPPVERRSREVAAARGLVKIRASEAPRCWEA